MKRKLLVTSVLLIAVSMTATIARAACVNKYVAKTDGNKKIFTLLTGKLTYAEAQELAKTASSVEWLDEGGNVIAKAVQVHAVRPMPVACDDKPSGSVINVTFLTFAAPSGGITIKFSENLMVYFEEQAN